MGRVPEGGRFDVLPLPVRELNKNSYTQVLSNNNANGKRGRVDHSIYSEGHRPALSSIGRDLSANRNMRDLSVMGKGGRAVSLDQANSFDGMFRW